MDTLTKQEILNWVKQNDNAEVDYLFTLSAKAVDNTIAIQITEASGDDIASLLEGIDYNGAFKLRLLERIPKNPQCPTCQF